MNKVGGGGAGLRSAEIFFTKLFKQARNSSRGVFANQYWKWSW